MVMLKPRLRKKNLKHVFYLTKTVIYVPLTQGVPMTKNLNNSVGDNMSPAYAANAHTLTVSEDNSKLNCADPAAPFTPIHKLLNAHQVVKNNVANSGPVGSCVQKLWFSFFSKRIKKSIPQAFLRLLTCLVMISPLAACNAQSDTNQSAPETKPADGSRVGLTMVAYNYTDRYIDTYSVNGNGGGNVFVSGPGGGGGGTTCCVSFITGPGEWNVKVRWQIGACTYISYVDSKGVDQREIHSFFKEVKVPVKKPFPDNPKYFETHFYADGHVEAAITEERSDPRLILNEERDLRTPYPRCPNDKKPQ